MSENGSGHDWSTKAVFSTGEAAEVCSVSQQTIIRCFDKGRLQGFRVPGSKFRRIPRDELIRFMRDNDIPVARLEGRRRSVLCLGGPGSAVSRLGEAASPRDRLDITVASSAFDAGWAACAQRPVLVLVDGGFDAGVSAAVMARLGEGTRGRPGMPLVVVVGELADSAGPLGAEIALRLEPGLSPEAIETRIVALLDETEADAI